jgi:deazaflavin-dependent oxidoreductase (nitroreductase family)
MLDLAAHRDEECCMFTTTGRRTGRAHRIEIWFGVDNGALYLISGNGPTADWFQNALADPNVTVELGEHMVRGEAAEVTDPDERRRIGELMGAKYRWDGDPSIGLTRHAWCFEVPLLRVDPQDGPTR